MISHKSLATTVSAATAPFEDTATNAAYARIESAAVTPEATAALNVLATTDVLSDGVDVSLTEAAKSLSAEAVSEAFAVSATDAKYPEAALTVSAAVAVFVTCPLKADVATNVLSETPEPSLTEAA